ncbi:unnamed protein product [Phytomonas sp. EM1]|nr:unnamed protein product [Phytomonas sp. EM1]|eukprot:CCW60910.1 unnamed protein product [Phytomonas sp. isolate EM1]
MDKSLLLQLLQGTGQEHLLDDYDTLTEEEKSVLSHQIAHSGLDFSLLNVALRESLAALDGGDTTKGMGGQPSTVEPPSRESLFNVAAVKRANPEAISRLTRLGFDAIAKGQVAVLLLAGGSGTRLGISTPKGLFTCELLREKKSLFQFHCEKVLRVQRLCVEGALPRAKAPIEETEASEEKRGAATGEPVIPVLIMISEENAEATRRFFAENDWFGLKATQVIFFVQGMLPCYDAASGRILMASPFQMCVSPGGNGGVYSSLSRAPLPPHAGDGGRFPETPRTDPAGSDESVLDRLRRVGVRYVQIFSVDNLLAKVADPLFYGYAIDTNAQVVVKTTPKTSPEERVGVFARVNGEWGVVEYTELGEARAIAREPHTGELRFSCANIACHVCSLAFLAYASERAASSVLYHAARKRIPTRNGPVMGVKLEAFIFDMFRYCKASRAVEAAKETRKAAAEEGNPPGEDGFRVMQVDRGGEFAPIKNSDAATTDTPTTAARLLLKLHTRWVEELLSGVDRTALGGEGGGKGRVITPEELERALGILREGKRWVEVSPLVSYQGEGLAPYVEYLVERLVYGSEDIVLVDESTNGKFGAAKI